MNRDELWKKILKEMESIIYLSKFNFEAFILSLRPVYMRGNILYITGPNIFTLSVVRNKYYVHLLKAGHKFLPSLQIEILDPNEAKKYDLIEDRYSPEIEDIRPNLNVKYTFNNFVVSDENRFAHATSWAISENPGNVFNPFFIYGKSGLGKTHLMHAMCHKILENFPEKKVKYVTCEQFTNELIEALKNGKNQQFRDRYRNLDCLMIDDIQFLKGKVSTQEEFFHTFNALYSNNSQIVLASDKLPKEIGSLEERLVNRFESGVVSDITMPGFETRVAILEKKASFENYHIETRFLELIAENITTSIRELESALKRVNALSVLKESKIDEKLIFSVLENMRTENINNKFLDPDKIIEVVAQNYMLTKKDIISSSRQKEIAFARHIAMYLVRENTDLSLPTIASYFGGRDHTSVIYGVNKISNLIETDSSLRRKLEFLVKEVKKI